MRFTLSRTYRDPHRWHPWFAWYPIWIDSLGHTDDGITQRWQEQWVWLEWIEKKGIYNTEYRLPPQQT